MKRIVIIGPESTGKSTLCEQLSAHFSCDYVPEYAREYLDKNGADYSYEDVLRMAKGQLCSESELSEDIPFHFMDTNLYVFKVWIEEKYKKEVSWIEDAIEMTRYDLYILCDIDLPWEEDEYREHGNPEDRLRLYNRYLELIKKDGTPYLIVSGSEEERLNKVLQEIKK
jgi:NadR type nicotinamide-nucleotide adenylyltransferase